MRFILESLIRIYMFPTVPITPETPAWYISGRSILLIIINNRKYIITRGNNKKKYIVVLKLAQKGVIRYKISKV